MTKPCVERSELVNVGAQIDYIIKSMSVFIKLVKERKFRITLIIFGLLWYVHETLISE